MDQFKASNGRRLTQGLFYEFGNPDAPYTLRDQDYTSRAGKAYTSAAEIYRNSADEYEAALKLLGSWSHWQLLLRTCKWFVDGADTGGFDFPGLNSWREEMALRDASMSKKQLQEAAEAGNVAAMRYLNEHAGKKKKVGRPEKEKPVKPVTNIQKLYDEAKQG